ncbi:holo-ACP synthase [Aestuariibacter halophilus]|uniref:Holo-[acyl-carrier-protein] synthase n=1 Tax=Fluctibacter halophilus TaxID=226011 RepID=A0ABS8GB17_9ALTE|nr:holo-ACP synthase [Aestuariibacter halophilus]MCC2617785.1 holo-ACP synthase [Aestuariibacter halophilus]
MSVCGIGTDIVEIARIAGHVEQSERLAQRVLTDNELEAYRQHRYPARFLAKRFAAKEAAVKALGTGIGNGISWQHIEVGNHDNGQPFLRFNGHFATLCEQRGITHSWLSIADEQRYATATVILEQR